MLSCNISSTPRCQNVLHHSQICVGVLFEAQLQTFIVNPLQELNPSSVVTVFYTLIYKAMLSKFSLIRLRTKKQRTLVVFVAWLHTSSGGYRSTPASVWFVGVTRFVCAEITRINEQRARRLQTRSLDLKSLQAGVFLFTLAPPAPSSSHRSPRFKHWEWLAPQSPESFPGTKSDCL